jgi:hypothetical protein
MSDLDRAYRALAREADAVGLAAPGALRGRADRRTRIRVTAAAVAAAVAVGGAVMGTQWVLRADGTVPPPPPAVTGSPTPPPTSAPPTSAPSTTPPATTTPPTKPPPTTPPPRTAPKSIPDSAFLQVADLSRGYVQPDTSTEEVLPSLCDATFAGDRSIDLRRTRRLTYYNSGTAEGSTPDGTIRQTITVYEPDRASRFLDELRDAIASCPTDGKHRYRVVYAPKRGDESLMFEDRYPTVDPAELQPTGGDDVRLISVVRMGDVVTILYETGWEAGWSADPDVMNSFTSKAVSRLLSWLD